MVSPFCRNKVWAQIIQIINLIDPMGQNAKKVQKQHLSLWSAYPSRSAEGSVLAKKRLSLWSPFFGPKKGGRSLNGLLERLSLWSPWPFLGPLWVLFFCLVVVVLLLLFLMFCFVAVVLVVVLLLFCLFFVGLLLFCSIVLGASSVVVLCCCWCFLLLLVVVVVFFLLLCCSCCLVVLLLWLFLLAPQHPKQNRACFPSYVGPFLFLPRSFPSLSVFPSLSSFLLLPGQRSGRGKRKQERAKGRKE